jgi:hypothetical protein
LMVVGESASDGVISTTSTTATIVIRLSLTCLNWFSLCLTLLSGPYSGQCHLFRLDRHPHSLYVMISSYLTAGYWR